MNEKYDLDRAIREAEALAQLLHRHDLSGEIDEYIGEVGFMIWFRMLKIRRWWDKQQHEEEGEGAA